MSAVCISKTKCFSYNHKKRIGNKWHTGNVQELPECAYSSAERILWGKLEAVLLAVRTLALAHWRNILRLLRGIVSWYSCTGYMLFTYPLPTFPIHYGFVGASRRSFIYYLIISKETVFISNANGALLAFGTRSLSISKDVFWAFLSAFRFLA